MGDTGLACLDGIAAANFQADQPLSHPRRTLSHPHLNMHARRPLSFDKKEGEFLPGRKPPEFKMVAYDAKGALSSPYLAPI